MEAQIVAALVGGIFTLIGIRYSHHLQSRQLELTGSSVVATASIDRGAVIRDVGIICFLSGAVGLILAVATQEESEDVFTAMALGNIIFVTIGFVISGARVHGHKWKHLFAVTIVLWLVGIINVVLIGAGLDIWLFSLLLLLLMMVTGGVLSSFFRRRE